MTKANKNLLDPKTNETFCILPWVHFHALPNKKVLPCCMAESTAPVSDTDKSSVIEIMNSEDYKKLRLNMLNGKKTDICKRCYDVEKLGVWSLRNSQNTVRGEKFLDLVSKTNADGSIDEFVLDYMDIRWSNICNFKCRSCGPEFSSLHAQEYADKKWTKHHLASSFKMKNIVVTCNESNSLYDKIVPYLNDVQEVYFAGGESLITPEHYQLLDYWEKNNKTDILLTYTTNFSVFNYKDKHVFDYWKKFKNIKIFASIDGDKKVGEYLRKGTVWKDIEENVILIKKEVPHVEFFLTPTISIWNVDNFPDFYQRWLDKGFVSYESELRLNILTHPWWANIQHLPPKFKETVAKKWLKLMANSKFPLSTKDVFSTVLYALQSEKSFQNKTYNLDAIRMFFKENIDTDNIRKEDLFKSIPIMKELLQEWLTLIKL
jgi:hypothetical protein